MIERFIPVLDRIVIKEIEAKEVFGTKDEPQNIGGIYIPKDSKEYNDELSFGEVLAVGNDVKKYELKVGDIISHRKKHGVSINNYNNGKEKYRLIAEIDVYAIIRGE